jgi:hypothetical protein
MSRCSHRTTLAVGDDSAWSSKGRDRSTARGPISAAAELQGQAPAAAWDIEHVTTCRHREQALQ